MSDIHTEQEAKLKNENNLLKREIQELQKQVYTLYKRIAELTNGNMERDTSNRNKSEVC